MKVIILSAGHDDSAIPMAKAISAYAKVDLLFLMAKTQKNNIFIHIEGHNFKTGLLSQKDCEKAIEPEVFDYVGGKFKVMLYLYNTLRIKSIPNLLLSYKLASLLRKYDLIHVNGLLSMMPHLQPLLLRKKFIFTVHDFENHSGERAKNFLARHFNKILVKSKYHVVFQNKKDFERVIAKYPSKKDCTHYIPFGTLDVYSLFAPSENTIPPSDVLFFGRISPYKGLEYFSEAMLMLKKDFPDIKYTIAGSGQFYFDDKELRDDPNCYIFNRFIKNQEMANMFRTCKIVVCPYTDATQSGVAMTAFTFNKPVIATQTGGFPDVVKDGFNGFLVPVKDSVSIFQKLKSLFENQHLLTKMEENIAESKNAGDFSWSKIGADYLKVYTF